jgi:hypothetical protein
MLEQYGCLLNLSYHAVDDFKLFRESMEYKDVRTLLKWISYLEFPTYHILTYPCKLKLKKYKIEVHTE